MKNFRTLNLAIALYRDVQKLKVRGAVRDQLYRAALSIPLNLSEGSAKPTRKDRRRFYHIALGSFRETETLLKIIGNEDLLEQADILGAHLYKLCKNT